MLIVSLWEIRRLLAVWAGVLSPGLRIEILHPTDSRPVGGNPGPAEPACCAPIYSAKGKCNGNYRSFLTFTSLRVVWMTRLWDGESVFITLDVRPVILVLNTVPDQLELDRQWMQRALELAQRGIGLASPNPVVGCVIVGRAGHVIGEGWHEYDRMDHAEVVALHEARKQAADRLEGGTAYVTLEPCNHTGRTPPCTQALIAAKLGRVVAATTDPNPNVAGHGLDALRAAGIWTSVGVCEDESRRLNEAFACWSRHKRPFVLMKVAMSLDGRIAPPADVRQTAEPFWITSEAARAAVQMMRWQADAVLVGVGTVLADDPLLTDRSGVRRRRLLLRVVLDSALRTPLDSKLVKSAQNDLVIFTVSNEEARISALRDRGVRVEILPADAGRVPLGKVLDTLGAENILTLLTESGTGLNTALLQGNHVDRIQLFVSPKIMGTDAVPAFGGLANPIHMAGLEVERFGGDVALSSLLKDPWRSRD